MLIINRPTLRITILILLLIVTIGCEKDSPLSPAGGETFSVYDAWWINVVDNDGDEYSSYRGLNFDVDVSTGTQDVYAEIYYKLSTSSTYTLYFTTVSFTITEDSATDDVWIEVGLPNTELSHDLYDFEIRIYKSGSTTLQATKNPGNDDDLNNQTFEIDSEDIAETYSIGSVWWYDIVDEDEDGYRTYGKLAFDPNVDSGTYDVYAEVWRKYSTSTSYTFYYRTPDFPITNNNTDDGRWVAVGSPNPGLSGIYDFEIRIFKSGSTTIETSKDQYDDADLNNQYFEF